MKKLEKLRALMLEKYTENIERFLKLLSPAQTLLDIGCGDGSFTKRIAETTGANEIFGIKIVSKFAMEAKMKGINVVLADANKPFPFRDCSFDAVVSNQVIEHINYTDLFVKECYRVLKTGGYAVVSTENLASLHNIFSLILGYQPFSTRVSDEVVLGNPLNPNYKVRDKHSGPRHYSHRRIFVARSLKELFEWHGFKVEVIIGSHLYPLPSFISRQLPQAILRRYGANITIKAYKPQT